jgi:hypothetical protein
VLWQEWEGGCYAELSPVPVEPSCPPNIYSYNRARICTPVLEEKMHRMLYAAPFMLGLAIATVPVSRAQAQIAIGISAVGISVSFAPPVLPEYDQPPLPEPGYIWAPGYWAYSDAGYSDAGYYWVPGTWVLPPQPNLLWTPGYWDYGDSGAYLWHAGYWGPHVGFYGGVNYGYGYGGNGYEGGYWQQNHFYYNRNANNFGGTHVTNVYERNVTNVTINRISYNGGHGGIDARPDQQQMAYQNEHHFGPTSNQMSQEHMAAGNKQMFADQNHGRPPIAATVRPADFSHNVMPAHNQPTWTPQPQHAGNAMTPQHGENGPGAQHPQNAPGMQHPQNATEAQHPQNVPGVQHPEQGMAAQHPQNAPAIQHQQSTMAPQQHPAEQVPHAVEPSGMSHPAEQVSHPAENVQHAQPAPAYHPPVAPSVQHEPAPQAYHPQQMQQPHPQEAQHPMQPAQHPQGQHPQEQRPQGQEHPQGGEHPPGQDHKS